MHLAVDLDGTIDQAPLIFASLMTQARGEGNTVTVLTGNKTAASKLTELGIPDDAYDQIVVLPDTTLPTEKAAWCVGNEVLILIDNKGANCLSCVAAGVPLALRPVTPATVREQQRSHLKRASRLLDD